MSSQTFWNDYPAVQAAINRRLSGEATRNYLGAFQQAMHGRRFGRGLFINCGNGWVEREFIERGIVASAVGVDGSEEMLAQARTAGAGLPLRYERFDINNPSFPDARYDLIVNYAAANSVLAVDRLMRLLCRSLTADGFILSYDYVGPHRHQYTYGAWEAVVRVNESLPTETRAELHYPHLPMMLAGDRAEAAHSELVLSTYDRYFTRDVFRSAGGALAYPLLTFNEAMREAPAPVRDAALETVLTADTNFLTDHPHSGLFAYWYGRAKSEVLEDAPLLDIWTEIERLREDAALAGDGTYYPSTLLQRLMFDRRGTGAEA